MSKEDKAVSVSVGDFSQQAVTKAVLNNTLQHPLTLYPTVLGVLGMAGTFALGFPFPVLLGSLSAVGGGVMSWIVNFFFRGDVFAKRYVEGCQKAVALQRRKLLDTMQEELAQCRSIPGAEEYSKQGADQLAQIQKRLATLQEVLADKLDRGELIYSRYSGVAEQVYLSVLDNLKDLITVLKSASTIDVDYLSHRLSELAHLEHPTDADREEVETLTRRKALREEQLQRGNVLLTRNEEAMTHLDDAMASVANMGTDDMGAKVDLETAIGELQRLAKVAQQFK